MVGIYKITSPSGKIYIGSSSNIKRRWYFYFKLNCKRQTRLYNSFNKYGVDNHIFEIISSCYEEQLNEFERDFQEAYDVIGPNGLNCKYVNTSTKNSKCSDETKVKIGNIHRNKIVSQETRDKISNSHKEKYKNGYISPIKGRKMSEEKIEFFSKLHKGKILSQETKDKISKNHAKAMLGRKMSPETVDKMNKLKFKKVINIITGEIYESTIDCSNKTGYNRNTLIGYLNGSIYNKTDLLYYTEYLKLENELL